MDDACDDTKGWVPGRRTGKPGLDSHPMPPSYGGWKQVDR